MYGLCIFKVLAEPEKVLKEGSDGSLGAVGLYK